MDTTVVLLCCLAVLVLYVLSSLFLLWNPQILHTRKHLAFSARNIAHRGGAGERIENTIEAYTHAVAVGADMLELDCHMTKDGQVVVSHDENLSRQTGNDVMISSLIVQELPLYKERLEVTFNTGHYSTGEDRKFVLLEDVFKTFPTIPINIEVKVEDDKLIEKVASLVRTYGRDAITVWATESNDLLSKCRKQNSAMPFMFTLRRGLMLLLFFYTGLLPFIPLRENLLQFYLPRVVNRKYIPDETFLRNRLVILFIEMLTMRKALFQHLVKRGIEVQLFVCNEDSDIEAAFAVGATGVMTDYPSLLSDWLRKRPNIPPSSVIKAQNP